MLLSYRIVTPASAKKNLICVVCDEYLGLSAETSGVWVKNDTGQSLPS